MPSSSTSCPPWEGTSLLCPPSAKPIDVKQAARVPHRREIGWGLLQSSGGKLGEGPAGSPSCPLDSPACLNLPLNSRKTDRLSLPDPGLCAFALGGWPCFLPVQLWASSDPSPSTCLVGKSSPAEAATPCRALPSLWKAASPGPWWAGMCLFLSQVKS